MVSTSFPRGGATPAPTTDSTTTTPTTESAPASQDFLFGEKGQKKKTRRSSIPTSTPQLRESRLAHLGGGNVQHPANEGKGQKPSTVGE